MKPAAGPILRRVGLLIEMACLLALVTLDDGRRSLAGVNVRALLIGGVVLGFLLWGVSLAMLVRDRGGIIPPAGDRETRGAPRGNGAGRGDSRSSG